MKLHRFLLIASMTMFALPAMTSFAQSPGTIAGLTIPGLAPVPNQAAWNQYLAQHPDAAAELQANPGQMYDPAWQAKHPHFQDWIKNHPNDWTALRGQGSGLYDEKFNTFLGNHPEIASDLRANPSLLYDPAFRKKHHLLNEYLGNHPNVWANLKQERYQGRGWGDWDDKHQWRDADWWRDHDPNWAKKHHPDWYSDWQKDGDWDDHHQWHSRSWWEQHDASWANKHHPDWKEEHHEALAAKHEAHEEAKEAKHEAKGNKKHGHKHGNQDNDNN